MKITIETPQPGCEDEIVIRMAAPSAQVLNLIYSLQTQQSAMTGYDGEKIVKLPVKDIYYFESVDNKVFAYSQKDTYEIHKKLYEIEKEYAHSDFLRISKSTIINISKIAYVKPSFSGRYEANLKNGEKVVISRQYVMDLKKKLEI